MPGVFGSLSFHVEPNWIVDQSESRVEAHFNPRKVTTMLATILIILAVASLIVTLRVIFNDNMDDDDPWEDYD